MEDSDYIEQIRRFNSDKSVISLKEKYNEVSFFEMIAKERSKTNYSAFLKWLLHGNAVGAVRMSPLMMLLDILVKRTEEYPDPKTSVSPELKNSIIDRSLKLSNTTATVEKPVAGLASDTIDIFLQCDVCAKGLKDWPMQIIIENNIDSQERGKKNSRAERLYLATQRDELYQLYVYLTPEPIIPERHYSKADGPYDPHFIHITYQDILDGIIIPLLASSTISSRARFFLEEFKNQLTIPSMFGDSIQPCIALDNGNSKELNDIWQGYKDLITDAALAVSEGTFWKVDEKWYDHQPLVELSLLLRELGAPEADKFLARDAKGRIVAKKGLLYKEIAGVAEKNGIHTAVSENGFGDSQDLLAAFWNENKRFLTALLCGIEEKDDVFVLMQV